MTWQPLMLLLLLPDDSCTAAVQELITEMIKANPNYKPPADYRPEKKYRKLRIPIEDYPGYNFIGLIIGPRGNTQKRMERVRVVPVDTRCVLKVDGSVARLLPLGFSGRGCVV